MSSGARTWAAWCSPTEGVQRAVIECLGDFADEHDVAWPGVDTIAEATGWGARAVQKALKALVEAGVLVRVPNYVRAYRRPGAHTMAYRLVVTLCRHDGKPTPPEPLPVWARRCTHRVANKVHPSRARGSRRGGERGSPPADPEGVNHVRDVANDVRARGERRAPEQTEEPPGNNEPPSSTVSPDARATPAATPLGAPPWCRTCGGQHHDHEPHVRPTPPPPGWRSSSLDVGDDVEVEDPPEGWDDEPFPELTGAGPAPLPSTRGATASPLPTPEPPVEATP